MCSGRCHGDIEVDEAHPETGDIIMLLTLLATARPCLVLWWSLAKHHGITDQSVPRRETASPTAPTVASQLQLTPLDADESSLTRARGTLARKVVDAAALGLTRLVSGINHRQHWMLVALQVLGLYDSLRDEVPPNAPSRRTSSTAACTPSSVPCSRSRRRPSHSH
jgi:hypothetical protein